MNKTQGYRVIAFVALFIITNSAIGQTYSTGIETKKADVNFIELANYYKAHPLPSHKLLFNEEEEEKPEYPTPDPSMVHLINMEDRDARSPARGAYLPVSQAPNDSFESTVSPQTAIPPDTHGAVDSQYCVTAINTGIHIQTRSGTNVSTVGLDAFWSAILPSGDDAFDPRVHYDPFYKRWIMVTDAVNLTTNLNSAIMVAVSATNDPTGVWHMYVVTVDPTNASWMDFPNTGFNKKWIMVTGNMFPNTGAGISGAIAYIFNYTSIMTGVGAPYTRILQSSSFSIAPAFTYDTTEANLYAVESGNGSSGQLVLWKVSGPVSTPVMTTVGNPTTTTHWRSGAGVSNFAPQLGSTNKVNVGDDRITTLFYRNHTLWCSHTVFLPATTATRCSIMWWQIDTNANPLQNGLIDDPTGANFYAYSSIAVNSNNDALIGCATFSSSIHPSGAYALHLNANASSSTNPPFTFRHGIAYYYDLDGTGSTARNRWGDYSGSCVDPRNDTDFWTIQEGTIGGTNANWDTWWANVQFCPKPLAPTFFSTPVSLCVGANGTCVLNAVTGATSYVWSVSGTGWSTPGSTVDSITIQAGTGTGTVNVLTYNSCGEGEAATIHITTMSAPLRPSISTVTPACIGSLTAVFIATSTGASYYNWQAIDSGWSGSGSSSSFTATVGTGTGMIICNSVNACGPSVADTIYVTPEAEPVSSFSEAVHVTNVNINDVVTFTGTAPVGSTYTWNFGGGTATPGTGAGPQSIFWTTAGTKTVTLTVNNGGCISTYSDTVQVDAITGVQTLNSSDQDIRIVPNPNDGSFKIVFNNPSNKQVSVTITDMLGHAVYTNDFDAVKNGKIPVTTSGLVPGNYTVSISIDGAVTTRKITVTK